MGMFDFVHYKWDCEKCGKPLTEFQSKDRECIMTTLKPDQIDNFYSVCDHCNTWHEFETNRVCISTDIKVTVEEK